MLKRALLLAALGAGWLAGNADACGCDQPRTLEDIANRAHDYVFVGKVRRVRTKVYAVGRRQLVTFDVIRLIRGEKRKRIQVRFYEGTSSCDLEPLDFKPEDRYLISAFEGKTFPPGADRNDVSQLVGTGTYSSHFCDLRNKLSSTDP
jgi:hypothetical protein